LAVLIAGSLVSPSWAPAGWTAVPFTTPTEYGHYMRHEADGSESALIASRQVCDCQPDHLADLMQHAFATLSKGTAVVRRSDATACG
jgi:hypothetical protein